MPEREIETEPEVLDGTIVEAVAAPVVTTRALAPVAVQAAAVAGAGLVMGVAAVAVVRGAGRRRGSLKLRGGRSKGRLDLVGTRTFLVDVHLVDRR